MDIGILHVPAPLRSAYPVPGIGATIGLAYAFYLFPLDFFEGHGAFWQAPPIEDIATEITALRYYVADQWHFPLFRTVGIAPPRGISITYMDALPLLAVFAKFLKHVFSVEWNYFGLWIGLCFVLQGLSAVFLLQALGVRGWLPAATVAALAVFTPAFLFRLFHTALNGHFLILLALALYFLAIRRSAFDRVWPWFCSLAWVSLWVQAYFFVMILTIFIGTAVQTAVRHRRGWPLAAAAIGVCIGGSLLLMWVSGFFWERSGWDPLAIGSPKWFGIGSMNVLSPVIPQWSEFFPGIAKAFGAAKGPYAAVGVIDATGGQYEGYNYLGAGILLLAAVALWLVRRDFALLLRKHWGLIAACVALTALAVTHRIEVGKWELLLFDEVPLVLENIRSSGKLFWPVGYLATAGAVALIAHRAGRYLGPAMLVCAVALQIGDTAWIRDWQRNWATHGYAFPIPAKPWTDLIRMHEALSIFPTSGCAPASNSWKLIADLAFHASASGTPVNTAAIDHPKSVDCAVEAMSVGHAELDNAGLLVFLDPRYAAAFAAGHDDYRQLCRAFDRGIACSKIWSNIEQSGLGGIFTPI